MYLPCNLQRRLRRMPRRLLPQEAPGLLQKLQGAGGARAALCWVEEGTEPCFSAPSGDAPGLGPVALPDLPP